MRSPTHAAAAAVPAQRGWRGRLPPPSQLAPLACLVAWLAAATATAEQPRDYMLDLQPEGSFFMVDHVGSGGQLTLQNSRRIYGTANSLTVNTAALLAYPLGDLAVRADLRILFLQLGFSAGYRVVWRNLHFEPGEDSYCQSCERGDRRELDPLGSTPTGSDHFAHAEGRAQLLMPLNEYVVALGSGAVRYEDRRDRSYDWIFADVHDGGTAFRFEAALFLKHRNLGAFGPYVQLLSLPKGGQHDADWAYGFNLLTRPGFIDRNDLLFITFLVRPGDPTYGQHNYYAPIRSFAAYRMMFEL